MHMLTDYTLDPRAWFADRKLKFEPRHFTRAKTRLTVESMNWIVNNLSGRYYIGNFGVTEIEYIFSSSGEITSSIPSFEDPSEATLYELTWS